MAYVSDESGAPEIYVQSFPASEKKWRVSTNGGTQPRWRRDGTELFYISADTKLMVVDVDASSGDLNIGLPRALFALPSGSVGSFQGHPWDLAGNGERFLFRAPAEEQAAPSITVVLNWRTELRPN